MSGNWSTPAEIRAKWADRFHRPTNYTIKADIATLLAAIDTLTAERDNWHSKHDGAFAALKDTIADLREIAAERDAVQAELAAPRSIVATADTCFGAPRFDGTRLPVEAVARSIEGGMPIADAPDEYDITEAQVRAAVDWWQRVGKGIVRILDIAERERDAAYRDRGNAQTERDAAQARVRELEGHERVKIGVVGVDSASLCIADPTYACMIDAIDTFPAWQNDAQAGQLRFPLGHDGLGVVFLAGPGDGEYPVYATYVGGRIAKVEVLLEDDPTAQDPRP